MISLLLVALVTPPCFGCWSSRLRGRSNLLVLGGDPLVDLDRLGDIRLRMKQGEVAP